MIRSIEEKDKLVLKEKFVGSWGSLEMVSMGKLYNLLELPGFIYGDYDGVLLYHVANDECEILLLESYVMNKGIGTALMKHLLGIAKASKWSVWLITTNDNTYALRFYQRLGFSISGIHIGAVNESRKLKPSIPLLGIDDIPIEHEIELRKVF